MPALWTRAAGFQVPALGPQPLSKAPRAQGRPSQQRWGFTPFPEPQPRRAAQPDGWISLPRQTGYGAGVAQLPNAKHSHGEVGWGETSRELPAKGMPTRPPLLSLSLGSGKISQYVLNLRLANMLRKKINGASCIFKVGYLNSSCLRGGEPH